MPTSQGRLIDTTSPGAMSVGVVGPSSVPLERWTSTLTPVQDAVGRVLHSSVEGVAGSVVLQDQSGAAANGVMGLIQSQCIGAATFFATGVATFFATGVATFFATGATTLFATGAVFTAAFSTFFSSVGRRAGATAVRHFHVNDVAIEGDACKFRFARDCQAGRYFLSRVQISQLIGAKLSYGPRSRLQVRFCLYVAKGACERVPHGSVDGPGCRIVLHGDGQPAEHTAPRLPEGRDRARHGGFTALSTALRTRTVFTAISVPFSTAMLTSRVATLSLGAGLACGGVLGIPAVPGSGADATAADDRGSE